VGFFDIVGSVLTGGLGGIVGAGSAIAGKIIDLKLKDKELQEKSLDHAHELALRDKDMAQARLEAESKLEVTRIDADSAAVQADLGALAAAVQADRATYGDSTLGRIVDFARGTVRPVLTAWASVLVSYVTWQAFIALRGVALGPERAMELVNDAMFLAGLAIAYWFGSRPNRGR
jgi:hypothetical protein